MLYRYNNKQGGKKNGQEKEMAARAAKHKIRAKRPPGNLVQKGQGTFQ